jgi:hypothetical protein
MPRIVLPLLLALFPLFAIADNTDANLVYAYHKKQSDKLLLVLRLFDDGTYQHTKYTNKKIYHDYGTYIPRRKRITFVSENKKRGFTSVAGKTYFVSKKGLHKSRMDMLLGKNEIMRTDEEEEYVREWTYNPLLKDGEQKSVNPVVGHKAPETPVVPAKTKENNYGYDAGFDAAAWVKSYYVGLTNKYVSPFTPIIEKHYCGPSCYYTVINGQAVAWDGDTARGALFSEFETVIHETVHHCNGFGNALIQPGIIIDMQRSDRFKSEEVKAIIPADAPNQIFRYKTYLGEGAGVSSNVDGIFGLMDEFSAYQNGCTAATLAADKAFSLGDEKTGKALLGQARGTYFAYYEFALFIAWYLEYAEQFYPEMYTKFMANKNLRVAFTLNEMLYLETLRKMDSLSKSPGAYTVYNGFAGKELEKHQATLNKFRVKGVTLSNYRAFITN